MFHPKFAIKNLTDYLVLLFLSLSFYLYLIENKQGLSFYYFLIVIVFIIFKFNENGFIKWLSQGIHGKGISFALIVGMSILLSNVLLFYIQTRFLKAEFAPKKYFDQDYLFTFLIFNSVRIFGEELIFRGFLLIKGIKENNVRFWLLNFVQAILFASIHSLFNENNFGNFVFTIDVFIFSIFIGWLNRRFNSLLPSWLLHFGNGIQNFFFIFT